MFTPTVNTMSLSLRIDRSLCSGCGRCVTRCRRKVLGFTTKDGFACATVEFPGLCRCCGKCAKICPNGAIEMNYGTR